MTMGTGAQASIVEVPNQRVLDALVQLSGGASFGFDQRAWHAWLAAENRSQAPTLLK